MKKMEINHTSVFRKRTAKDDEDELSPEVIFTARTTGVLKLSNKGLRKIPHRVYNLHKLTDEELKELNFKMDLKYDDSFKWWNEFPLKILDLSCNCITNIDSCINDLDDLEILDMHSNSLNTIPTQIAQLKNLKKLNISDNKGVHELPKEFFALTELRELTARNLSLFHLEPDVGDLVMLNELDLAHNNLIDLPIGLGYLVRLTSLDLSYNKLKFLPPDITNMRALKKLDLNGNELEYLIPLGELKKLETIFVQSNKLHTFPNVSGCISLKELQLNQNEISEMKVDCLSHIHRLTILNLAHNQIEHIPKEINNLINLEYFDLSNNKISHVPYSIGFLPNLKQIQLNGNNIKNIRSDILRCGTPRILKYLQTNAESNNYKLSKNVSDEMLEEIHYPDKYIMKNTKLLSMVRKDLSFIPTEILQDACDAGVTTVDLSDNKLSTLPSELGNIVDVRDIKLACNKLNVLPDWFGCKFQYLQTLNLSKNCLKSLPNALATSQYLKELDVSFNKFIKIPNCVYAMIHIEILKANDNQIDEIEISNLELLKLLAVLDLSNNNINYVPPKLGNLDNIKELYLTGNKFKQPRQAILSKGTNEILAYLRSRIS